MNYYKTIINSSFVWFKELNNAELRGCYLPRVSVSVDNNPTICFTLYILPRLIQQLLNVNFFIRAESLNANRFFTPLLYVRNFSHRAFCEGFAGETGERSFSPPPPPISSKLLMIRPPKSRTQNNVYSSFPTSRHNLTLILRHTVDFIDRIQISSSFPINRKIQ